MLLAVLCFTLLDAVAKRLVGSVSPLQVAWGRYAFSLLPLPPGLAHRLATCCNRSARPQLRAAWR
jgi:hypothetical protein